MLPPEITEDIYAVRVGVSLLDLHFFRVKKGKQMHGDLPS
jgi:hypothetical protein